MQHINNKATSASHDLSLEFPDLAAVKFDPFLLQNGLRAVLMQILLSSVLTLGSANQIVYPLVLESDVLSLSTDDRETSGLFGVMQSAESISFDFKVRQPDILPKDLSGTVYFDPNVVSLILQNNSALLVTAERSGSQEGSRHLIKPRESLRLMPGIWGISAKDEVVFQIQILSASDLGSSDTQTQKNASGKRPHPSAATGKGQLLSTSSKNGRYEWNSKAGRVTIEDSSVDSSEGDILIGTKVEQGGLLIPQKSVLDLARSKFLTVPSILSSEPYVLKWQNTIYDHSNSFLALVNHDKLGKLIIVKVIRSGRDISSVIRASNNWEREVSIHRGIKHDSIISLLGADARHLSLFLEDSKGPDLTKLGTWRDQEHNFIGSPSDVRAILRDTTNALAWLHGQRIWHCDIKPANILYDRNAGTKLCDFGLARTDGTDDTSLGGTPFYIPPEFISDSPRAGPSDVWALGVTALYLLRKMPVPDYWGKKLGVYWQIREVHDADAVKCARAQDQQRVWLKEVDRVLRTLTEGDDVTESVRMALVEKPMERITAGEWALFMSGVAGPAINQEPDCFPGCEGGVSIVSKIEGASQLSGTTVEFTPSEKAGIFGSL